MAVIGITGARVMTGVQQLAVKDALMQLIDPDTRVHVCDAPGVDALALEVANLHAFGYALHEAKSGQAWALQKRSKAMVDSLRCHRSPVLHGWPNKKCPRGITRDSWKGSGTWGTLHYAALLGVPVVLHWELMPASITVPDWVHESQMQLI